jgi:hypothetical protein
MADDVTRQPAAGRTPVGDRRHPVHVFAGRLTAALEELAGGSERGSSPSLLSLSPAETTETVREVMTVMARLRGLQLAVLAHADVLDVAATVDAASTAAWLRTLIPLTGPGAVRDVKLATALTREVHAPAAEALAEGRVLPDQAPVIVAAIDALPASVGPEDRRRAEEHLVDLAAVHDARTLHVLGRRVLEVIDPDAADAELARRLEAEEAAAARATSLTMVDDGRGTTHGRFRIPTLTGQMLRTALHAIANPTRPDAVARAETGARGRDHTSPEGGEGGEGAGRRLRRATPAVLGDAFVEYVERFPSTGLPTSGGLNATVVVTVPLETLEGRLKAADLLGSHHQLSPAVVRRLACASGVVPAVLDGNSRVLDLGRRARTASPPQRLALTVQQGGTCGVEHCDRPTTWADAHHWRQRWTDGGRTDVTDLVLLCRRHHTLAHLPGRVLTPQAGGRYRIQRT